MAKKVGLKIGGAIAVGAGLYFFYTSEWYKSRYTGFFKKRKIWILSIVCILFILIGCVTRDHKQT